MVNLHLSRRQFLKGAAAAVVAGPSIIPASALGRDGRAAPSGRIHVGLIGSGPQGVGDMRNILGMSDTQVLAVCDVDTSMRNRGIALVNEQYARQSAYKGCAGYNDFRELLGRGDIDAVIVATPDHWHSVIGIEAAKAGCDIYGEKPLTLTIRDSRALVNAVRRYGRVFQTGSQQRSEYGGRFRTACELVRNGYIGQLKEVFVSVQGPPKVCSLPAEPVPAGLDWDMWLGPAPYRPFNKGIHPFSWRGFLDYGGGSMTDMGAHHFDIAQWAMDMDHSGPVEIHPPDGKDFPLLTYVYANGVRMYHQYGDGTRQLQPPYSGRTNIVFVGDKGHVAVSRRSLDASPRSLLDVRFGPNDVRLGRNAGHHRDWVDCIHSRQRPICDAEVGCRSATVCHLGIIAYWLNRPLRWDPVKEDFVGDAEASRWLQRPKRAPWNLA